MESLEDTPEVSSNECEKKEEETSTSEGSYIKERQCSLEYLDLQVKKPNQKSPDQSDDLLEDSKTNKISNTPLSSSTKSDAVDVTPPGTDELNDQSFDNAFSDMYNTVVQVMYGGATIEMLAALPLIMMEPEGDARSPLSDGEVPLINVFPSRLV